MAVAVGHKRPQRNNLATALQIQKHAHQVVVELGGKGLVVDKDDVCPLQGVLDDCIFAEVALFEVRPAWQNAPELASGVEFALLVVGELACILHHLAAYTLTANLQRRLQHHVAHARPQIDKDLVRPHLYLLDQQFGDKGMQQLAIYIVGSVLVFGKKLHVGSNGSVVYLVEDKSDEMGGQLMQFVEVLGDDAVLDEHLEGLVVFVYGGFEACQILDISVGGFFESSNQSAVLVRKGLGLFFREVGFGNKLDDTDASLYCVNLVFAPYELKPEYSS